jgi:hypothetical protein
MRIMNRTAELEAVLAVLVVAWWRFRAGRGR